MAKNKIVYASYIFSDDDETLRSGNEYQITSLIADELQADTIELEVKCSDKNIVVFTENAPLQYYRENLLRSTYYVQSIKRIGGDKYTIQADSAMGLLMKRLHVGGICTGQTVKEVVNEICGNIPILVKTVFADTKLYGWLPYCKPPESSARNNLAQVLYAIGAALTTDNNGVLRVEPLWDGVSSSIGETRMYFDGSVETEKPISAVTVTEHQYIAGTDEKELFSGTSQQGDIITFSEPMHSLIATGFTILESGANYAKISSGSGSLKGKTYIHNTRLVTQTVTENAAENVKSVTDATLVSLVNSSAVAKRLADYYKCRETITNGIVSGQEKPGHVVSVYHPYDKCMVSACIVSLDTTMSGTLKSDMTALVGFSPPQPDISEYYDTMEILTGSGEWTIPAGVTSYTRVLIGAAQGGRAGRKGADAASGQSFSDGDYRGYTLALGGAGGEGGEPGAGGKVLVENITGVSAGDKVAYSCGVGGEGSADPDTDGSPGTATTMGNASSDSGASSDAGYADPITGKIYAALGLQGLPGGDGAGRDPSVTDFDADTVRQFVPATSAQDEDGNTYAGGDTPEDTPGSSRVPYTMARLDMGRATYSQGLGGGAAAGAAGTSGTDGRIGAGTTSSTRTVYAGAGADGASAAKTPRKPTLYGQGGRGGYGGGGGGSRGFNASNASAISVDRGVGGVGGLGSLGGPGADGCIVLYYRKYAPKRAGWVREKNRLWLIDRLGRRVIV